MNLLHKSLLTMTFALPVLALPVAANAQTPANTATPNLDQRQVNQQNRIAQGISSGELTAKEASNLEKREAKLESDKQLAKADGNVTKAERRKLQHEANRDSRKIYRKKHNQQKADSAS